MDTVYSIYVIVLTAVLRCLHWATFGLKINHGWTAANEQVAFASHNHTTHFALVSRSALYLHLLLGTVFAAQPSHQ